MIIGVPKEIKKDEYRVALVPGGVRSLVRAGHQVLIEQGAGVGSGISDQDYRAVGAQIVPTPEEVFARAEMILKVKEPLPPEYPLLREGQILFTYLHLAASPSLTQALLERQVIGIAYETVRDRNGTLPLLTPMSEIAGRMAIQEGAKFLEKEYGGRGVLLSGVPGVLPGEIVIIGGGVVGTNAAKMAIGIGATVTLLDINLQRLRYLDDLFGARIRTLASSEHHIAEMVSQADVIIGAALIPGARTPHLITREMLRLMRPGTVIVDVSIDQGGTAETSRPTSHSDPVFVLDGIVHYCVTNIPGAVARTSTLALTNATLPYVLQLAQKGYRQALLDDPFFAEGLNLYRGQVTHPAVAEATGHTYMPVEKVLTQA
ncbi:MAG: alanine dehydrogenase [Nitrospinota bacterium]|nr:MAG: alanine dehydrogenase [Nitrospinota bacterium]